MSEWRRQLDFHREGVAKPRWCMFLGDHWLRVWFLVRGGTWKLIRQLTLETVLDLSYYINQKLFGRMQQTELLPQLLLLHHQSLPADMWTCLKKVHTGTVLQPGEHGYRKTEVRITKFRWTKEKAHDKDKAKPTGCNCVGPTVKTLVQQR